MKILTIKKMGLFNNRVIWLKVKVLSFLDYKAEWLEGVDLLGYWKKGDSFIIKHPSKDIYWCVSRGFIKKLGRYKV